jgi:Ca2+-dependent lipid-binding protein
VTIESAKGVRAADTTGFLKKKLGSSDPYCVIKWGSTVIGKTKVQKQNLNPR